MNNKRSLQFHKIVAIDWSGAKDPRKKIQVAECDTSTNIATLADPPNGTRWRREDIWERYFRNNSEKGPLLIGFDLAFAYPFSDRRAYFPGSTLTPSNVRRLWETVNALSRNVPDFYGGPFYLNQGAGLTDYLLYQTYRGSRYEERFRLTDRVCQKAGLINISSVFKCVGASVGVGSLAGMRLLHQVQRKSSAHIWPFCNSPSSCGTTVVEIYPALFLHRAGVLKSASSCQQQVNYAFKRYEVTLSSKLRDSSLTGDERDALVSVAGMKGWLCKGGKSPWTIAYPNSARFEGWIFGI